MIDTAMTTGIDHDSEDDPALTEVAYISAGGFTVKTTRRVTRKLIAGLGQGDPVDGFHISASGCDAGFSCVDDGCANNVLWIPNGAVVAITSYAPEGTTLLI